MLQEKGAYKLSTQAVGYLPYERVIAIIGNKDLGTLMLKEDIQLLNEVTTYGKIPPAEQKGDTTSFNARAYKTRPDADAEGLLMKMPGMEISNGTVKAQGEDVQQVLVDGKVFFGGDATLALKSLPAEVIARIEVFDQLSEQAQFTGFDDGNSKKTINIITNSKAKNSQFGKLYGGLGLEDKYIVGGNINLFNEEQRISLIGIANNLNIQNFASQDLSGMTSDNSSGRGGSRGGGRGRGGSGNGSANVNDFLVGQQNGIIGTNSFGINYADKWDKLDLSASYFFNKTSNQATSITKQNFFVSDSASQLYEENSQSVTDDYNHRFNLRGNYKINDKQSITFRPNVNFQTNDQKSTINGINSIDGEQLSATANNSETTIESFNVSNDLVYRLRLNKAGRTISVGLNTGWSGNKADNSLNALTEGRNTIDSLSQYSQISNASFNYSANFSYTERIFQKAILQLNYTTGNQIENAERYTYDSFIEDSRLDSGLSNVSKSDYQTQRLGAGIRFRNEQWNASLGLDFQYASLSNKISFPEVNLFAKNFTNVLPNARISYTLNNEASLRFNYRTRTRQPSIGQLQAVLDNSNPLSLTIGNSDLSQQVDHTFITRYSSIAADKSKTFIAFLYAGLSNNYIGNTTFISTSDTIIAPGVVLEQGGQLMSTTNFNQSINSRLFLTYGRYLPWLKSNLNLTTSGSYSQVPGIVNEAINMTENTAIGQGVVLSSNISNKIDFTLGTKGNYTFSRSSLQSELNNNYYQHTADLTAYWSFTAHVFWENSLSYQQYFGLSEDLDQPITLWNMGVGFNFLKENRGQLKLSVYDLLNQNNSISRVVTDAYVEDTQTNILQRYYLLSFTYNLRRFGTS
ncbi:MAG: hypothetical protein ACI9C9_002095 [Marivirga sp.]